MQAKWWHFAVGAVLLGTLLLMLWRSQSAPTSPVITDSIPAGANAKAALELKHE